MKRSFLFQIAILWAQLLSPLFGAGVAVTKEQRFHPDESAMPFVFQEVKDEGRVVVFQVAGQTVTVERTTFLEYIEVPAKFPDELTTPEQFAPIQNKIKEITNFETRFPLSEPILRKTLEAFQEVIRAHDAGWLLYHNQWVAAADLPQIKKAAEETTVQVEADLQKQLDEREHLRESRERESDQPENIETLAQREIDENSAIGATYQLESSSTDKSFVTVTDPKFAIPFTAYLEDAAADPLTSDRTYTGDLYFCGSHSVSSTTGELKVYRAYHRSRQSAFLQIKLTISKADIYRYSKPSGGGGAGGLGSVVWVEGYFRKDGKWVCGHYRDTSGAGRGPMKVEPPLPPFAGRSSYSEDYFRSSSGSVHVGGYTRKDGTYVHSYTRRR